MNYLICLITLNRVFWAWNDFRISFPERPEKLSIMAQGSPFSMEPPETTYSQSLALCPIVQCIWLGWSQEDERHPAPQEREHSSHTPDLGEEPEVHRYDKTRLWPPTTCGKTWTQMKVSGPLCSLCFSEWGMSTTYPRNVQRTHKAKRHAKVQSDEEGQMMELLVILWRHCAEVLLSQVRSLMGALTNQHHSAKCISTFQKPPGIPSQVPPHLQLPVISTSTTAEKHRASFLTLVEHTEWAFCVSASTGPVSGSSSSLLWVVFQWVSRWHPREELNLCSSDDRHLPPSIVLKLAGVLRDILCHTFPRSQSTSTQNGKNTVLIKICLRNLSYGGTKWSFPDKLSYCRGVEIYVDVYFFSWFSFSNHNMQRT